MRTPSDSLSILQTIVGQSAMPAALITGDFCYDSCNLAFQQLFAQTTTTLSIREVWGADVFDSSLSVAIEACRHGELGPALSHEVRVGGRNLLLQSTLIPYPRGDGQDFYVLHRVDVARLLGRYQSLIDHAPSLISVKNREGRIVLVNQTFDLLNGPAAEDYLNRTVFDLFPAEVAAELWKNDRAVFDSGGTLEAEEVVQHKDGTMHTYLTHKFPIFGSDGQVSEVGAISLDITERKFFEAQALHEKLRAEKASQVKSDFLANMSHEIRTPLTVISGYAQLFARRSPPLEGLHAQWMQSIAHASQQLDMIINDILNLAKVEAGKIDTEKTWIDPVQLLAELRSLMLVKAAEKNIDLRFQVRGPIPTRVRTDPLRLKQILINLIGNAIKFTEEGGVDLIVERAPTMLNFRILDSGIGLALHDHEKLFQPFSQIDHSMTRKYGGTGLGLVLSRRLAELLGGSVYLESSEVGRGSCFVACIDPGPQDQLQWSDLIPDESFSTFEPRVDLDTPVDLGQLRILLVEDTLEIQKLLALILTQKGGLVKVAQHGREALDLIARDEFDLILMDLQMPVMDGLETTRLLRLRGCQKPIIAITAHALVGEQEKCLEAGCTAYVSKPIRMNQLLETMMNCRAMGRREKE